MKFNFRVSNSPTIHLEADTLANLEKLREKLAKRRGKLLNYDKTISYLINRVNVVPTKKGVAK